MKKKHCIYIVIMIGFLSVSACAREVVEEVSSPEKTAIALAKTCVVVNDEASGLRMSAQEAIIYLGEGT